VLASVRRPSSGVVIVVGPEKYLCAPEEFSPCNILAYYATNAAELKRGEDPNKGLRELLKARKYDFGSASLIPRVQQAVCCHIVCTVMQGKEYS
jgi:hypothetical protein